MCLMLIKWKRFLALDPAGLPLMIGPEILDPDGTLLEQILTMPIDKPIKLQAAFILVQAEFFDAVETGDVAKINRLTSNWVKIVSEMGYQIKLTGEEYWSSSSVLSA
jgi:hypothetical protein